MASPKLSVEEKRGLILSYYAGFSESFVRHCLSGMLTTARSVLDPWNGSGTTTSVCSQEGIFSCGIDVNPVANVIAVARSAGVEHTRRLADLDRSFLISNLTGSHKRKLTDALETICDSWLDRTRDSALHLNPANALLFAIIFRIIRNYTRRLKLNNPTWVPRESLRRIVLHPRRSLNYF